MLVGNLRAEDNLDNFGGANVDGEQKTTSKHNMIHIQFQQRTTRKCLSIIQGLPEDLDLKKIVRHFKKTYQCMGAVVKDQSDTWGEII